VHPDSRSLKPSTTRPSSPAKDLKNRPNMKYALAALAHVGMVSAQESVLNLFLLGFTSQSIVGSIITSVSSTE
jgi:hypothetical protein